MALLTWMPRLVTRMGASRVWPSLAGNRSGENAGLLSPQDFDHSATCERMRVDRNNSVLSILLITLPARYDGPKEVAFLSRVLQGRLRITDTAGQLRDGRIGVLLPDTPAAGAWKVASDICEVYDVGEERPDCEVMEYPDRRHRLAEREEVADGEHDTDQGQPAEPVAVKVPNDSDESFFSYTMPAWKRVIDVMGASAGLLLASPLIGVGAAAVALTSKGGPFFIQDREGLGGRKFRMYKLRTMRVDAEARKAKLRKRSEQDGPAFKMTRDPRTTFVGRILRKTSVDELPQLLNVLRGDMSLVGPRPLPVDESQDCQPWQRRRLTVTPGITCIWQVYARNVASFDDWVRMDLQYAQRVSPWQDFKLIARTPISIVLSKGPR